MPHYRPRHAFLSSEPAGPRARRRVVLVRAGIGLAMLGAALVIGSVFVGRSAPPVKNQAAPAAHPKATSGGGRATGTSGASATGTSASGTGATSTGVTGTVTIPKTKAKSSRPPTTPTTLTTNPATASTPAQDLVTPAGFGPLLRSVWVAADPGGVGLSAADVQSTYPGSVYYAGQATLGQYWSLSRFVPSAEAAAGTGTTAGKALLADFASNAVFYRSPGHRWAYVGDFPVGGCPDDVPGAVLQAWGICTLVGS